MTRVGITDEEPYKRLEEFTKMAPERQRFLIYSDKLRPIVRVIRYETEEKLCYFMEEVKPMFVKKGFLKRRTVEGYSFLKKEKKLNVWYGKSPVRVSPKVTDAMMIDLGAWWFTKMSNNLRSVLTRTMLEKIVKGNIKSAREYVDNYVKSSLRIRAVNSYSYYQAVRDIYILMIQLFLKLHFVYTT